MMKEFIYLTIYNLHILFKRDRFVHSIYIFLKNNPISISDINIFIIRLSS